MEQSVFRQVAETQMRHQEELLKKFNVVGTAVGYKDPNDDDSEPAVVVLVEQKKPLAALSADDLVPRDIEGIRTDVVEVGFLQAQQTPTDRFRPIPAGVSIGHYKITAGTFGAVVFDKTTGEQLILSNNHVLANSNEAFQGDAILQPAAMDGGNQPQDVVGTLHRWSVINYLEGPVGPPAPTPGPDPTPGPAPNPNPEPLGCDAVDFLVGLSNLLGSVTGSQKRVQVTTVQQMAVAEATRAAQSGGTVEMPAPVAPPADISAQALDNTADVAVAKPADGISFTGEILNIGKIDGTKPATIGQAVRKHGRTTGFTTGTITLLNATVNVSYITSVGRRTGRFSGQIITTAMSQGGDSGSVVVDAIENKAVGLLFAGSPLATIMSPIDVALDAVNVRF